MKQPLESLSKEELIALGQSAFEQISSLESNVTSLESNVSTLESKLSQKDFDIAYYKDQIAKLQRMLFGQKRERFESAPDGHQMTLPFELEPEVIAQRQEEIKQKIQYVRSRPNHKGRAKLPEHLEVEEVKIYPQGDLSQMVCIGEEITEELEFTPAKFYIKRYIRYKYAPKSGVKTSEKEKGDKESTAIKIGALPSRVIDKGIPSASLLSIILCDKYLDHLPLYRQKQRFARDGIEIPSSTIEGWTKQSLEKLEPLYEVLEGLMKEKGYLQVDETPIKVQDRDKKGALHQGYYWVYHSPLDRSVMVQYAPSRSGKAPLPILQHFKGYLQTDGYAAYEQFAKNKGVTHVACWAHARREFERALDSDRLRASIALELIRKLYAIERRAREEKLDSNAIKRLRLEKSLPLLNEMSKWIASESKHTLPKSQIGKAMNYAFNRWDQLCAYLYDGSLHIDNNPVENTIRPIALGRKNYLFAGSHDAAQRAAMIYSFFATCKKNDVNPFEWLKHTLENIMDINHKELAQLLPQNYKQYPESNKM